MATAPDTEILDAGTANKPLNAFFADSVFVGAGYTLASATVELDPDPGDDVTVASPTVSGTTAQALFTVADDAAEATYQVKWEGTFTKTGQAAGIEPVRGRLYIRQALPGA